MKLKEIYNDLITEGRTQKIASKKATQIFRNNCRMFDDTNTQVYRGISGFDADFGIVRPKEAVERRTSAHAKNFYTLVIDNSKAWNDYPDRGESIVCTTDLKAASGYGGGNFHLVVPFDNALFGIASSTDIWSSFKPKLPNFNRYIHSFAETAHRLANRYSKVQVSISNPKDPPQKSYKEFKNYMERVDRVLSKEYSYRTGDKTGYELILKGLFGTSGFGHGGREFVKKYLDFNGDLIEYFKFVLDPELNRFEVKNYNSNFNVEGGSHREVWTHDPCLLVHERAVGKFIANLNEYLGKNFYIMNFI